jgi:hypothetical protein
MRKWVAAVPLVAALGAAWAHFTGNLDQEAFRRIFLVASALWFILALWAQSEKTA